MIDADVEVRRILNLLRNKIRDQGYTQLEVQETLSWGRTYISQLLTRQKSLRVGQVLLILDVIGIQPTDFFDELYGGKSSAAEPRLTPDPSAGTGIHNLRIEIGEVRAFMRGLSLALVEGKILTREDLAKAVEAARDDADG